MPQSLRVGYVLKRFPRVSETFIGQEILELERRGVDVFVFTLTPNDGEVPHDWIGSLRAPVTLCGPVRIGEAWRTLRACRASGEFDAGGIRRAADLVLEHPQVKAWRYLGEAVAVARAARQTGIAHLHAHFANRPAFTALLAHHLTGVPFSFTAHAKDIYAAGPPPSLWRRQVRRAAFAVTVSRANCRHLEKVLGARLSPRLRLLYNGVDLERIRPARRDEPREGVHVLCTARLVEKKGIDLLLDALAMVRDRGERIACTILGDGPQAEVLRNRVAQHRLGDLVRLGGAASHEKALAMLRRADLFVLPCRVTASGDRDALPTVLLEAMAAGLPCISTPVGGVPEIIDPGATGILVPPESPAGLAEAVMGLARDAGLRERLGRAGRRRAEALFDRRANVGTLHRWMLESAGRRMRRGGRPARLPGGERGDHENRLSV